jgi:regulatory protein
MGEACPPPDWLGDVSVGVEAWTRRANPAEEPVDEVLRGPEADPESVARKILLDQLTGQARSRKELADKLAKKLVPAEIATRLLDRFEEVGLIDDAAFARLWVDSRQSGKGLARRALAQELRRKGIADEVAREALDEVDPADEEAAARALVAKRLRSMARLDDQTKTRRLVGMLARKGYPPGLAMSVVRAAVRASASAAEDHGEGGPDAIDDIDDLGMPESHP